MWRCEFCIFFLTFHSIKKGKLAILNRKLETPKHNPKSLTLSANPEPWPEEHNRSHSKSHHKLSYNTLNLRNKLERTLRMSMCSSSETITDIYTPNNMPAQSTEAFHKSTRTRAHHIDRYTPRDAFAYVHEIICPKIPPHVATDQK